jgi:XXXCH domain-containing protein
MESVRGEIERLFEKVQEKTRESQLPEMEDVKEMLRLSKQLQLAADEDWVDEAEDVSLMADKLLHAVKRSDVNDAIIVTDSLDELLRLMPG